MSYEVKDLVGKTFTDVKDVGGDIHFHTNDGDTYVLVYLPDCCASCNLVDTVGDLNDLVGVPLIMAEEVTSHDNPDDRPKPEYQDSFTWTFYKFATTKGYVTLVWYGESNGYYSETATLLKNGHAYEY
jgi:hypothetical protein